VINLTSWHVRRLGSVRVFRDGTSAPSGGSLMAWPGQAAYGQLVVPVGSNGKIAVQNNSNGTLDLTGYVTGYIRRT
jgi:hypothetical protein